MRNGVVLFGELGRGEMKFGMGTDDDGGEIRCLAAAEIGVLARGGWNEFCGRAE